MKKRSFIALLLVVLMAATTVLAAGCNKGGSKNVNFTVPENGYDGSEVTITFSHTMGTNLTPVLNAYIEEFNKLFGYERLDPFFTFGVKGWMNDGDVGPYAGLGALYYLSDEWAFRGDLDVTLGLEREIEVDWSFSLGFQYSF